MTHTFSETRPGNLQFKCQKDRPNNGTADSPIEVWKERIWSSRARAVICQLGVLFTFSMGKKRDLDEKSIQRKTKKIKLDKSKDNGQKSTVQADDVDFPRGGGTTFTPLEVKTLRAEAAKEADKELFGVSIASEFNVSMLLTLIPETAARKKAPS